MRRSNRLRETQILSVFSLWRAETYQIIRMQNLISLEEKCTWTCPQHCCWNWEGTSKPTKAVRITQKHARALKRGHECTYVRTFTSSCHCPSAERWYLTDGTEKRSERRDTRPPSATNVILFLCVLLTLALATLAVGSPVPVFVVTVGSSGKTVEGKQTFTFTFFHRVWGISFRHLCCHTREREKKKEFSFDGNAANSPSLWMFRCFNRSTDSK